MDGWTVITLNDEHFTYFPVFVEGWLEYGTFPAREQNFVGVDERSSRDEIIYYWQAPVKYYGNRVGIIIKLFLRLILNVDVFVLTLCSIARPFYASIDRSIDKH